MIVKADHEKQNHYQVQTGRPLLLTIRLRKEGTSFYAFLLRNCRKIRKVNKGQSQAYQINIDKYCCRGVSQIIRGVSQIIRGVSLAAAGSCDRLKVFGELWKS